MSADEEDKDEDEELGHDDDEEDVDEMNHTQLPKEVCRAPSPRRVQKAPVWKYLKCITKDYVLDREIQTDCTHICVHQLSDDEGGSKRYCNSPNFSEVPRARHQHGTHRKHSNISRRSICTEEHLRVVGQRESTELNRPMGYICKHESADPVVGTSPVVVCPVLNVAAGEPGQPRVAGFFTPRGARMLVMLRMNHEFMEYMRGSYPDTPLSEFKVVDTYVCAHGGLDALDDDEDDE